MGPRDKKSLELVLAEFRTGIAHHRAQGAIEQRIRQLLGEAIWLAFQQVKDPELRAWLCDEFSKAARVVAYRDEPSGEPEAALKPTFYFSVRLTLAQALKAAHAKALQVGNPNGLNSDCLTSPCSGVL